MVKTKRKAISLPTAVCIGSIVSILFLLGFISFLTYLVLNESINEKAAYNAVVGLNGLAAFVGCVVSMVAQKKNRKGACFATGGCYYALLLISHYIVFPGTIYRILLNLAAVMIGTSMAFFVGNSKKGTGRKKIKKYRLG